MLSLPLEKTVCHEQTLFDKALLAPDDVDEETADRYTERL